MPATLSEIEILRRLVGFDSTSSRSNVPIADYICGAIERPGVRIERMASEDGQKVNVLAWLGPAPDETRQGLILCAHLDTVPAAEPEWKSDPFTLVETPESLVGRGACDMKGFVALAVGIVRAADPMRLRRPLGLLLTYDEEVGSHGAQRFAQVWPSDRPLPRSVLIGEPTGLRVVRMHKGHLKMRITLRGMSAHSGYPHLGRSAIEPAGAVIQALATLRQEMEQDRVESSRYFPETPFVTLNIGRVRGGEAVNVIPDRCDLDIGLRPLPGSNTRALTERVRAAAVAAAGKTPCAVEVTGDNPPLRTDDSTLICRTLSDLVGQRESHALNFASDGGHLQRMGLECVLFGPGVMEVAHKPNEWMARDQFSRGRELLTRAVERMCVEVG